MNFSHGKFVPAQGTKVPESLQAMRKERLINEMYKYSRCRGTGTLS